MVPARSTAPSRQPHRAPARPGRERSGLRRAHLITAPSYPPVVAAVALPQPSRFTGPSCDRPHARTHALPPKRTARCREPRPRIGPARVYTRVYTGGMKIVKVRRVGNSNVMSIPREFEASGYTPGSSVLVEDVGGGELRILPTDRVRERVRQIADRVVSEHPEAIEILANHDPDERNPPSTP
jgi:antitoxin component of MazEF toxin-antitoxin module